MQFYYDGQIRRYITQFIRLFSDFSVEMSVSDDGIRQYQIVPAYYGDMSRQVANIIRNNSENTSMSVPAISCYITGLAIDRDRTAEPYFVDKKSVRTRAVDPQTGEYTTEQGNMFTVERHMPTPFKLTMKADLWTSSTEQKLQLLEQIIVLFNPSLEIQTTDNFLDWTSLSVVTLNEIQYATRAIPQGLEDQLDVASLTFEIPIWLSLPAKVKKLGVIQDTILRIGTGDEGGLDVVLAKQYVSIPNGIIVVDGQATLTNPYDGYTENEQGQLAARFIRNISWTRVTDKIGPIRNGTSKIYLEQPNGSYVVGLVSVNPLDDKVLLFEVDPDTMPTNTLAPINRIVDPIKVGPEDGLPMPIAGQRYLLTQATGSIYNGALIDGKGNYVIDGVGNTIIVDDGIGAKAWLGDGKYLIANANDIVEYDGQTWNVVFDASEVKTVQYVTNLNTNIQYKWTGKEWVKSWEGYYPEGTWNLVIE